MSLTVDQLLAADDSSSDDEPRARVGSDARTVGTTGAAHGLSAPLSQGGAHGKAASLAGQKPTLTVEEALAQGDLSDEEEDDDAPIGGVAPSVAAAPAMRTDAAAVLPSVHASDAAAAEAELSDNSGDQAEDEIVDGHASGTVGLDEILAMGSDSSSEDGEARGVATVRGRVGGNANVGGSSKPGNRRQRAEGQRECSVVQDTIDTVKDPKAESLAAFVRSPFTWCLEHERMLLQRTSSDKASPFETGGKIDQPLQQTVGNSGNGADTAPPMVDVEAKACVELRRVLAQEYDRPTCAVSQSKYIGVGTVRGNVVLLDPKLQDSPAEPQVLVPPAVAQAGEEASAVSAVAVSADGSSMLVGHRGGQLVLWDLATQRVSNVVKDVHSCAVASVAFCRPTFQYALSADAGGSVFFLTFTSSFGRRDCTRQLLLEQSSNIGVVLRILPLPPVPHQQPGGKVHPADAQCLVALCATCATVLLTLHPSAQLLQKMQYHTKDVSPHASWVPDAAWLQAEKAWLPEGAQASDPQLCVAFGQTLHIMTVGFEQAVENARVKEEWKISLLRRFTWACPIQGVVALNESLLGVFDGSNKISIVQLPCSPEDPKPVPGSESGQLLTAVHVEDVSVWSPAYQTCTSQQGCAEAHSHHSALSVFQGRSRTLYVCGIKDVWALQVGRWGQRVEELVGRDQWSAALGVFLGLHQGVLPPLLDFPQAVSTRQKAVASRATQVIQSYLASKLQQDTAKVQVREMCAVAVHACIEMGLWSVLYKTVFECFKATGHMNVYCNMLEPFIVKGKIPRGQMDSEVLSSILQSYTLPLEEEEQSALQHIRQAAAPRDGDEGNEQTDLPFVDMDHCTHLFPVALRLQQLVLYVDVAQLDLNLAIRLFTQHRLWTALVHVYCALGDYGSPLELLVGECTQLAKRCPSVQKPQEGNVRPNGEGPLLECILVRKLFYFLQRCFELRAFPLDPRDGPGMVHPGPGAISQLLQRIFKPAAGSQRHDSPPTIFLRLLRLSPLGLFNALAALYTSPSASHAVRSEAANRCVLGAAEEPLTLNSLFRTIEGAVANCQRHAASEGNALPVGTQSELLWFVARAVPRAGLDLPPARFMEVAEHLLESQEMPPPPANVSEGARHAQVFGCRSPDEAQQLLIGVLAAQDDLRPEQRNLLIGRSMQRGFFAVASWLHEQCGEYDKALDCRLQDDDLCKSIFEYIISELAEKSHDPVRSQALVEATLQRLRLLVAVDAEHCAVMICTQFTDVADHGGVLERLQGYPQMELQYLETLLVRRQSCHWRSLEEQQAFFDAHVVRYVELLCSLAPTSVLPFVMENETLPLRECLELCRKYVVTDASVHLLERTGDFVGVLELFLSDYAQALEQLHRTFVEATDQNRAPVAKVVKRLMSGAGGSGTMAPDIPLREAKAEARCGERGGSEDPPWWEGLKDAQHCVELLNHAYEMSARNSSIMTEAQLEELWFGVLGRTVQWQERAVMACRQASREAGGSVVPPKRQQGLTAALARLASQAMAGALAYLSLPRSLKWICAEFGSSGLGVWKDPMQSMLSGLNFQQGLLRAARAVAAQDAVKPFALVKRRGSRGVRCSPSSVPLEPGGELRIRLGGLSAAAAVPAAEGQNNGGTV